eukprot:scaffold316880_cov23-Prasinocladus_malaysianus.AAC.1
MDWLAYMLCGGGRASMGKFEEVGPCQEQGLSTCRKDGCMYKRSSCACERAAKYGIFIMMMGHSAEFQFACEIKAMKYIRLQIETAYSPLLA